MMDRFFDNYVMTPMQKIVFDRIRRRERAIPMASAGRATLLDTAYSWLEGGLAGRSWAAGEDFSLADCAAAPSLHYANRVQPIGDRFPALTAYLGRLEARPSFASVLADAAPYSHMFPQEPA